MSEPVAVTQTDVRRLSEEIRQAIKESRAEARAEHERMQETVERRFDRIESVVHNHDVRLAVTEAKYRSAPYDRYKDIEHVDDRVPEPSEDRSPVLPLTWGQVKRGGMALAALWMIFQLLDKVFGAIPKIGLWIVGKNG